jgi:hypothetical protein
MRDRFGSGIGAGIPNWSFWRCPARNGGAIKPSCRQDDRVLPQRMPVIDHVLVVLRKFRDSDIAVVLPAAGDPLIPLITTVPAGGTPGQALVSVTICSLLARQESSPPREAR